MRRWHTACGENESRAFPQEWREGNFVHKGWGKLVSRDSLEHPHCLSAAYFQEKSCGRGLAFCGWVAGSRPVPRWWLRKLTMEALSDGKRR